MQLKSEVIGHAFLRCSSYRVGNAFEMSYLSLFQHVCSIDMSLSQALCHASLIKETRTNSRGGKVNQTRRKDKRFSKRVSKMSGSSTEVSSMNISN